MNQYANAIGQIESDNDYGSLGPVTSSGDRAYGRYQVMGNNVPDWTEKHFGQRLTPQQFLANPKAQDAVFDGEFGGALQKYGNPQDAASVWFSGRPLAVARNASDGYNTTQQYVNKFNRALGMANEDDDNSDDNTGQLSTNKVLGNGVLFKGSNDTNPISTIGQGLVQAGASLAGITSPGQAYALTQQLAQMKKDNEGKYKMALGKNGEVYRIDPDTGRVEISRSPYAPDTTNGTPSMLGDVSKQGDDYLATLQPVDQQMVSGMLDGTIPAPSAYSMKNPRVQQLIAAARQVDPEFDANKWAARNTMAKDLAKSNPASLGGILANGQSAFRHLGLASDGFVGVGNSNGYDGPGGNLVAQGYNALKNYGGSAQLADKLTAANEEISKYGTESTKYYAGSPGGVHERAAAQKATDPWTASGAAQAGYVDASKNLMIERGKELEAHIRDTMGQRYLDKHPVFSDETNNLIGRIDKNVATLRSAGSKAPKLPTGVNSIQVVQPQQ